MAGIHNSSVFITFLIFSSFLQVSPHDIYINYDKDSLYMDGKPFRYVAGSMHYFRIPGEYWRDRLQKAKAAGLNAISTYVEWSQHEAKPGIFDFSGNLDLQQFIKIAGEENLFVILRPGPYICAERDLGGLPYWLLNKHPNMALRTNDQNYMYYVERWMNVLFAQLSTLLYGNGGPIIMVQVENEYGSYFACDKNHLIWLRDLFQNYIGTNAVLFTTDGAGENYLNCGKIPGVYATVDFNPLTDVNKAFSIQRKYEPRGPLVNSEYYTGWLTHWGEKMAHTSSENVTYTLLQMLQLGANVNFYMFHGGTNFGFTAGANFNKKYTPVITSYDYDAPISESGDLTEKYYAIKEVLRSYFQTGSNSTLKSPKKGNYGTVELTPEAKLFSTTVRKLLGRLVASEVPLSFEAVDQNQGYLLYETILKFNVSLTDMVIDDIRDMATVYVNDVYKGTLSREFKTQKITLRNLVVGDKLQIVVENMGRINFGPLLNDKKGILSSVILGGNVLNSWNMTSFSLDNINLLDRCSITGYMDRNHLMISTDNRDCLNGGGFTFYHGTFTVPNVDISTEKFPLDTFLDVQQLVKGVAFVNGYNLGRYWSRGPQYSLYVPGVYLKPGEHNTIIIMEEAIATDKINLSFSESPVTR